MEKKVKKVLFRVDSSSEVGLGHFMRCKVLADALLKLGVKCHFAVITSHDKQAFYPHQYIKIRHENEIFQLLKEIVYLAIIIDTYQYTSQQFKDLSLQANKLIILDDECNRGNLHADVIFNPVALAIELPYKRYAKKAQLFLGADYILLSDAYNKVDLIPYTQRKDIVITMGGSDPNQLTLPLIEKLHEQLPHLPLVVITGKSCKASSAIEKYCLLNNINYRHNVQHMEKIFVGAKLAISAAGSTLFELAKCGVPSIFSLIANNQQLSVKEHQAKGWCSYVDCRESKNIHAIVQLLKQYLNDLQLLEKNKIAMHCVDGLGAKRVASIISKI